MLVKIHRLERRPRGTETSYRIVGQRDAGSSSTECIPITWLQKIADEEVMSFSPSKKARWDEHNIITFPRDKGTTQRV
jgi:hypothetical protein